MKASCYLTIVPSFRNGKPSSCRVDKVFKTLPGAPSPGTVVVKVNLDIPERLFGPQIEANLNPDEEDTYVVVPWIEIDPPKRMKAKSPRKKT